MSMAKHPWAYLLPKLWATLFEPPVTVEFPFKPLKLPPGFRGKVTMQPELCLGCGLCVRDCPTLALEIERSDKRNFRIRYKPAQCAYCGQCELSCHRGAIRLTNDFNPATDCYQDLLEILVERNSAEENQAPPAPASTAEIND